MKKMRRGRRNMKTIIVSLLFGCLLTGCAAKLQFAEKICIERAKSFPLEFVIPETDSYEAWGRAHSFVGRFSTMRIAHTDDFIVQTYSPLVHGFDVAYGYTITKTPMGDRVQITVRCATNNRAVFGRRDANLNAHILALYIATGELCSPRLIAK